MSTDEITYRHYLAGEEKAAAVLVEKYGDNLTLYLNGYLRDMHEAEDLMIEAFSLVFAKERPIAGDGSKFEEMPDGISFKRELMP